MVLQVENLMTYLKAFPKSVARYCVVSYYHILRQGLNVEY